MYNIYIAQYIMLYNNVNLGLYESFLVAIESR